MGASSWRASIQSVCVVAALWTVARHPSRARGDGTGGGRAIFVGGDVGVCRVWGANSSRPRKWSLAVRPPEHVGSSSGRSHSCNNIGSNNTDHLIVISANDRSRLGVLAPLRGALPGQNPRGSGKTPSNVTAEGEERSPEWFHQPSTAVVIIRASWHAQHDDIQQTTARQRQQHHPATTILSFSSQKRPA